MKKRWKLIVAAVATVTTTVPVVATLSPTAAFGMLDYEEVCISGTFGYMAMESWAGHYSAAYPEGNLCAWNVYYQVKAKYTLNGQVYRVASTPSSTPGFPGFLDTPGTLMATCHGYRYSTSQPFTFRWRAADGYYPDGGGGTKDCDQHGTW